MKEILIPAISTALIALVTWLTNRLIALINTKIENQRFAHYLTAAVAAVTDSVKAVQQDYVDTLKKNGTFDEAAAKEAFEKAKTRCLETLSVETKNYISGNVGDINNWIDTTIHSVLHDIKEKNNGNSN